MQTLNYDRVIIGGGIFGVYAAVILAQKGHKTLLVERDDALMQRASYVNQARLHTGLHYPRSLMTASESKANYERFSAEFEESIKPFYQIYAISRKNSKTSAEDFRKFLSMLNTNWIETDPDEWFFKGTVDGSFRVEEPTFDANILREILRTKLKNLNVEVWLGVRLIECRQTSEESTILEFNNGKNVNPGKVILTAYASTNDIRDQFKLPRLPLSFELAEIVLGTTGSKLANKGFTVMDGPFWSLMPFGDSGQVSLTSVGFTPTMRAVDLPSFSCQEFHTSCNPQNLFNCNSCQFKPKTLSAHHVQQMKKFLKDHNDFHPEKSLHTIKTILRTTQIDDGRPTLVVKDRNESVITVFSGKLSTIFDLEQELI